MKRKGNPPFDPKVFLAKVNGGRTISDYRKDKIVYGQGDPADSVFFTQSGKVKKTVVSDQGKEAVVALLEAGDFFGEGCLAGEVLRLATVSAVTECVIARIAKADIIRVIHEEPAFAALFISHLLARKNRVEEGSGRSAVQFQRETSGTGSSAAGEFWQGRSAGAAHSKNQPRDPRRDDRHDAIPRQFFHE
jgi:CRP-like cAMP-binding protein